MTMDDVLRDFLTETNENLVRLEHEVLELERAPTNGELLNSIFRTVHTVKGTCGFFELPRLKRVAHACESVLSLVRDGRLDASRPVMTAVLEAIDVIRNILAALEQRGAEPSGDDAEVIAQLDAFKRTAELRERSSVVALAASPTISLDALSHASSTPTAVRVHTHLLERLDQLCGELLGAGRELARHATGESTLQAQIDQISRIAASLDDTVRSARMQPIGEAWKRLPRVVRDLAQETGKPIELALSGGDTEVDRHVLQAIQDPLMHLVRNCADHGIETRDTRREAGKPECGRITLTARRAGGDVVVEVSDDGAGLDVARIRTKAIERRLLSHEIAAALSDDETLRLIFQPGFSTAERVTNVSGRGVGMDVVHTNIAQIGGVVELSTQPGVGTTIRVRLPARCATALERADSLRAGLQEID
jgi:two-component system chemotaxis sensor kinase CheA